MREILVALFVLGVGIVPTYATIKVGTAKRTTISESAICSQAKSFFKRLRQHPSFDRQEQYIRVICGLVASGTWSKLDALWILAAEDQATANTNLISASYGLTVHGTMSFGVNSGYTGEGALNLTSGSAVTGFSGDTFTWAFAGGALTQSDIKTLYTLLSTFPTSTAFPPAQARRYTKNVF
jgi:hypothetical protein